MPLQDLREFLDLLEGRGQLARVRHRVSAELEITEITDRVSKGPPEHNRALLFEQVEGSTVPVAINLFGSAQRMAWALGVEDLDELGRKLAGLLDLRLPEGLGGALNRGQELLGARRSTGPGPPKRRRAPVQQIVQRQEATLAGLPILRCWPKGGGRFISPPQATNGATGTGIP